MDLVLMSSTSFQRMPSKKLKITHLLTAQYNEDTKEFITVLGKVKRARIVATVIDKKFFKRPESAENSPNPEQSSSARMVLTLDDGTGILRAINWNATETTYSDISIGNDVEVFGIVKTYRERPQILPEIVRRLDDPNYELLRDLEIKKQLKSTPVSGKSTESLKPVEVPEEAPFETTPIENRESLKEKKPETIVEMKEEKKEIKKVKGKTKGNEKGQVEIKKQISPEPVETTNFNMKDKIYEIILTRDTGNGVSIEEIQEDSHLDIDTLKSILKTLEKETAIGETRPGFYQPL